MKKKPCNLKEWLRWKFKQFEKVKQVNIRFAKDFCDNGIQFYVYENYKGKELRCIWEDYISIFDYPMLTDFEDFVAVGFARYCKEEIPHSYIKARDAEKLIHPCLFYVNGRLCGFVEQDKTCSTFLDIETQTLIHLNHNTYITIKDFYA